MGRKNRRPAPAGVTSPWGIGVDINRNFDIVWNFPKYYNTALSDLDIGSSKDPRDETYVGDITAGAPPAEAGAQNAPHPMRTKDLTLVVDFPTISRHALLPRGL